MTKKNGNENVRQYHTMRTAVQGAATPQRTAQVRGNKRAYH